jgi:hypothetical protein
MMVSYVLGAFVLVVDVLFMLYCSAHIGTDYLMQKLASHSKGAPKLARRRSEADSEGMQDSRSWITTIKAKAAKFMICILGPILNAKAKEAKTVLQIHWQGPGLTKLIEPALEYPLRSKFLRAFFRMGNEHQRSHLMKLNAEFVDYICNVLKLDFMPSTDALMVLACAYRRAGCDAGLTT